MMDNPETDDGIDNNSHPLRSRDNLYDRYSDAPAKIVKSSHLSDATSLKSPSSLTNTTKLGSQSSLRSAISMKESSVGSNRGAGGAKSPISNKGTSVASSQGSYEKNGGSKYAQHQQQQQELDRSNIKISNKNLAYSGNKSRSKEYLTEGTVSSSPDGGGGGGSSVRSVTPVPAQRKMLKNASRTHLVEGIPQTEV